MRTTITRRWLKGRSTIVVVTATLGLLAAACSSGGSSSTGDTSGGGPDAGYASSMPDCPVHALDNVTQPVDITIWNSAAGKTKDSVDALVNEYNASQNKVKVTAQTVAASYESLWNKYQQSAPTGDLPNIAVLEDQDFLAEAESGTVIPAQACINADNYDTSTLVQTAVDSYSLDGALVPASAQLSGPVLYYNKNHFRAAGLDPNKPPTTLAELRDTAQKLHDAGVTDKPLVLYLHPWFIETWLTGAGQPVVNNDNGRGSGVTDQSTFASDDTTQIYTWIKDMYDAGLVNAIPYNPGTIDHYLAVANGSGSMLIETSAAATSIKAFLGGDTAVVSGADQAGADLSKIDVGVGALPGLTAPGKVEVAGGAWYMTTAGSAEQQAAAWDFMKWWNTPEVQSRYSIDGSYLPFNQAAVDTPEMKDFWTNDPAGTWLSVAYDQLVNGIDPNFPGPIMGPFSQFRDAVSKSLDKLVLENQPVDQAIGSVVDTTNSALAQYNQGG